MNKQEWQELHNDVLDDNYNGSDTIEVEIEWGSNIMYECQVEVRTYNDVPADADCVGMTRYMFDPSSGAAIFTTPLEYEEFPHFIARAAEKKALGY